LGGQFIKRIHDLFVLHFTTKICSVCWEMDVFWDATVAASEIVTSQLSFCPLDGDDLSAGFSTFFF